MGVTTTNTTVTGTTTTETTPIAACYPSPPSATGSSTASSMKGPESRVFLLCLRAVAAFCWAASRRTLERMLLAYLQSTVNPILRSLLARLRRGAAATSHGAAPARASAQAEDSETQETPLHQAASLSPSSKKVSWSYMRGVSLALGELCQEYRYGGGRIPLSAILDLMREHQSAFVPLGPHVEKDVPKRLIQLANDNIVFFDPFEEYVVVLEETRQKYASRRQELLEDGVDPADLRMFGAALTQGISPSKKVTNTVVASYKEQFLLTQRRQRSAARGSRARPPTREESLMSIADAIRPLGPRIEAESPDGRATHRGHSLVMDMAKIIGRLREDVGRSTRQGTHWQLRGGGRTGRHSVLPEMSAIIHQRDALEVENDRLRAIVESR